MASKASGHPKNQPTASLSFRKLIDKLHEIVVLEEWSGEVSIHSYRGGISSAIRIKHFEDTKDGEIVYKKEDLMS